MMENRLKELCMGQSNKEEYYHQYLQIRKQFSDKLRTVPAYFPHFSAHDVSHSENIIRYLSMLLGEEYIAQLSISDLFIICTAAYAHDIGMALSYKMIHEKMTSDEWNSKLEKYTKSQQEDLAVIAERLLRMSQIEENYSALEIYTDVQYIVEESFRSEHAKRSALEIENNENLRNFLGIRLRYILSEVCRLHGC